MIFTFKHNLESVKVTRNIQYLGQRSFSIPVKVLSRHTHTNTQPHYSIWTTKVVGEKRHPLTYAIKWQLLHITD